MLGEIVGDGDVLGEIVGKCRGVEICHEGQATARAASKKGVEIWRPLYPTTPTFVGRQRRRDNFVILDIVFC